MTFDPFGDFEAKGYLRNIAAQKDLAIVKRLEHTSFLTGIGTAFAALASRKEIVCGDVLRTHKTLFDAVYPWAGQDRAQTAPLLTVKRGTVIFADPPISVARLNTACTSAKAARTWLQSPGRSWAILLLAILFWTATAAPS